MKRIEFVTALILALAAGCLVQSQKAADTYNHGLELHNTGSLDAALAKSEKAIELYTKYIDAYNDRANIKLTRGDFKNDPGDVVGSALFTDGPEPNAFFYSGGELIDLGPLAGAASTAFDINNRSEIVGVSGDRTFLFIRPLSRF